MESNFTSVNLRRGHFVLIFRFSVLALLLAGMAFIFCRHPLEVLLIGIFLMGPGNASIPLLLSVIRKHSLKAGLNATRLNTQMRTGVSIVWIAGPALALVFADRFGFTFNFLASALLATLSHNLYGFRITLLAPLVSITCAALLMFCVNRHRGLRKCPLT